MNSGEIKIEVTSDTSTAPVPSHSHDIEPNTTQSKGDLIPEGLEKYLDIALRAAGRMEQKYPGSSRIIAANAQRLFGNLERFSNTFSEVITSAAENQPQLSDGSDSRKRPRKMGLFAKLATADFMAGYDEEGLSRMESLIATIAFPTSKGYQRVTRDSHPNLFLDYKHLCDRVASSDDPYVRAYLKTHNNTPLMPRLIVTNDDMPQAVSANLPWSKEPVIIISSGLLASASPDEAISVIRHELAHSYKQTRDNDLAKRLATILVPFYRSAHVEEKRADLFAPKNAQDLRNLKAVLGRLGDVFEIGENFIREAIGTLQEEGLIEELCKDMGETVTLPNARPVKWVAEQVGKGAKHVTNHYVRKYAQTNDTVNIDPDGKIRQTRRETFHTRKSSTHPTIEVRCAYLEEEAQKMDRGAGFVAPAGSKGSFAQNAQRRPQKFTQATLIEPKDGGDDLSR
jgi:hypothetical protein